MKIENLSSGTHAGFLHKSFCGKDFETPQTVARDVGLQYVDCAVCRGFLERRELKTRLETAAKSYWVPIESLARWGTVILDEQQWWPAIGDYEVQRVQFLFETGRREGGPVIVSFGEEAVAIEAAWKCEDWPPPVECWALFGDGYRAPKASPWRVRELYGRASRARERSARQRDAIEYWLRCNRDIARQHESERKLSNVRRGSRRRSSSEEGKAAK